MTIGPPLLQTVRHEVTGIARVTKNHAQLVGLDFQNARGREDRIGVHVVIGGLHRFWPTSPSATRERTDLYFGLGVDRDAERRWVVLGLRMHLPQVREDGVRFGNLFLGTVLRTRRNR